MAWKDVKSENSQQNDAQKVKFTAFEEGTIKGRILDDQPYTRWVHWIPKANGGKGGSVTCIGKECPCCIENAKHDKKSKPYTSRKLHSINFLNRDTGEVEILERGNALFEPLSGFLDEIGDLRNYDIKIRISGKGKDMSYVPIPMPPKPLTEAEKNLEKYDLKEFYKPPTPEQIIMLMNGASYREAFGTGEDSEQGEDEQIDVDFTK
jgi:hypothetical protein